jgi:hypothetical protein
MLDAMRRNAARLGYRSLVAPVRPSGKHAHPQVPMTEYATWRREDGMPATHGCGYTCGPAGGCYGWRSGR